VTNRERKIIKKLDKKYEVKGTRKFKDEYVRDYFSIFGYTVIFKKYKNQMQKLKFICPKGHKHSITFCGFRGGHRCYYCRQKVYLPKDVKNILSKENYVLIGSYKGKTSSDQIKFKCPNGHISKTKFGNFVKGTRCRKCYEKSLSFKIEEIKNFAKKHNYQVIGNNYKNQESKLNFKCAKGHIYKVSYKTFKKRINKGSSCKQCYITTTRSGIEVVREEATKRNHVLLSKKYIRAKAPLKFKCEKGHFFTTSWDKYRSNPIRSPRSNGCKECGRLKNSLKGAYNYKGYKLVRQWAREKLFDWKKEALEDAGYTCFVSGKQSNRLEIHHVENFSKIFDKAIKELKLQDHKYLSTYRNQELLDLEVRIRELHKVKGVVLLKHVHKLFHDKYGKENNTWEQLIAFKNEYPLRLIKSKSNKKKQKSS
jgi:hypothetical protein